MATEEFFQLIFETKGQQAIDDAQAQLTAVGGKVAALNAQFAAGSLTEEKWREGIRKQAGEMARVKDEIEGLNKAAGNGSTKMAGFGQSMLQSGRIVQDFAQGGLGGIINNIEGFTQALGLGSGLAGVLTIVGTGLLLLKPKINEFIESMKGGDDVRRFADQVQALTARAKELEEKPLRLRVEQVELDQAKAKLAEIKAGLAEVEAQQKRQNVHESESGKLVQEALDESTTGAAGIKGKGVEAIKNRDLANSITIKDAIAAQAEATNGIITTEGMIKGETDPNRLIGLKAVLDAERQKKRDALQRQDQATKTIGTAAEAEYGNLLIRAKEGHGRDQAEAQAELARLLGSDSVGEKGVAGLIRGSSPAAIKAGDADIEAQQDFGDRAARGGAARRARAAREKKEEPKDEEAELKKWYATPEGKAHLQMLKERGVVDQFGQREGQEGFDEKGAAEVARKAQAIKAAPKNKEKLPPLPNQARMQSQAAAQQKEDLATQIHYDSNGGFNPDQSRHIAGRAIQMAKMNGDLSSSLVMAVSEMQATISHLANRFQQQQQHITGVRGNNQQVNRRLQQGQPSGLNSGGGY